MRALLFCGALVACGGAEAEPIGRASSAVTLAADDDGDVAAVALLSGDHVRCSGVLVAPRLVLTAAHCVDRETPEAIAFGDAPRRAVVATRIHPAFDRSTLDHDLALVAIDDDGPVAPAALPSRALDASIVGADARVVGFGAIAPLDERAPARRRAGHAVVATLEANAMELRAAPSLACGGDSGGPVFVGGAIVGVVSSGDPACRETTWLARVDVDRAFVDEGIPMHVGCAAHGRAPNAPWAMLAALLVAARRKKNGATFEI